MFDREKRERGTRVKQGGGKEREKEKVSG